MANTLKIKRGAAATIPQGQLAEPLFTTDTYDLYIGKGSGGNQRIQNYIASGTSSQFLKGDGSLDSTTYQTALTFSSPLVNTSGTVTINQSSGSANGYLSSTDWTTFNSKEPAITAGTTSQYYRGDKTFQTLDTAAVPENGSIYFTEPRVRATVLTGLNLSGGGTIAATDSILTAFGKVQNQISALVGGATYQGTWNASTNTPTLASGTGTKGYYYVVSVAGSTNLDGITDWKIGDWAIFNGTTWDKVDNTDAVSSVNGFTGAVNLALDNISDVSAASPTNAQLLRFNGTSSLWENWTPTFEPALTKGNLTSGDTSYLTVSGGTGAVIGSGTTISILASGIVNGGLTLTTTGNSGAATFSSATLNIPNYTLAGLGGVPTTRTITINGTAQDLSADRSWSVGTITGSGTASYVPKFTGASAIGNSQIVDDGTSILIGVTSDQGILQINGAPAGGLMINASDSQFGIAFKNSSSSNKKWDFSPQGNNLQFNESGVAPVMIFKAGGGNNVRLYSYASNGFLKTSSSDGTLIVDTTSYLPLTGGTLTGALSGTSATFSGVGTFGGATDIDNALSLQISSNGSGTAKYIGINKNNSYGLLIGYNENTSILSGTGAYIRQITSDPIYFYTSSTNLSLTLASTGAATFSSSVTANGILTVNEDGVGTKNITIRSNWAGVDPAINVTTNNALLLMTNNTERMRITSGGDMLMKTNGSKLSWVRTSDNVADVVYLKKDETISTNGTANLHGYDGIIFRTAGTETERMRITSGGDVGIGTTSPNARLTVVANDSSNPNVALRLSSTGYSGVSYPSTSLRFGSDYPNYSTWNLASIDAAYTGSAWGGSLIFYTNNDSATGNLTERMRINSSGEVLVGTTSAGFSLSGRGNITINGSSTAIVAFKTADATKGFVYHTGTDMSLYNTANGSLTFGTNDTERMKITSGGNVELNGGSIKTGAPSGGTAKPWKLGARLSGTVSTSTTNYLEVEIDGTLYYLAFAVPL